MKMMSLIVLCILSFKSVLNDKIKNELTNTAKNESKAANSQYIVPTIKENIISSPVSIVTSPMQSIVSLPPMPVGPSCACASKYPPCCTPEFISYSCGCAPRPLCPSPCNEDLFINIHDTKLKEAMKDAYNQGDLAQKAKIQLQLFQQAQELAKEVGIEELKAKQYATVLNEATRKAQMSRNMMFQTANQIRYLTQQIDLGLMPIKCNGPRCPPFIPPRNPLEADPEMVLNTFRFKEKNLK